MELSAFTLESMHQYTSFQNGRHFSALLFTCKLALSNFEFKNEATRANLQVN